jgi:hypothetical protein
MRQRGRKSTESLLVVPSAFPQRPDPPKELSPDQADLWRGYVGDMPADWFTSETWPLRATLFIVVIGKSLAAFLIVIPSVIPSQPR